MSRSEAIDGRELFTAWVVVQFDFTDIEWLEKDLSYSLEMTNKSGDLPSRTRSAYSG
jgi:hypothetical protein